MQNNDVTMRVVVFKDGDLWIAQGLERDICARGSDLRDVQERFKMLMELETDFSLQQKKQPLEGIEPAPKHFHDMWEQRSGWTTQADHMQLALCA